MARDKDRVFRMKKFEVSHARSSNKVGVDGVLIGAWSPVPENCKHVLDVGCGCGIITLMLAQRIPDAEIEGIDIEKGALEEAAENCKKSIWHDRIEVKGVDFNELHQNIKNKSDRGEEKVGYDLIVSNPPFFDSGVKSAGEISGRLLARHIGSLSPERIIKAGSEMITDEGIIALIAVAEDYYRLVRTGKESGLKIIKASYVRGNPDRKPKRVLIAFTKSTNTRYEETDVPDLLTIQDETGSYSVDYNRLCADFYLKF